MPPKTKTKKISRRDSSLMPFPGLTQKTIERLNLRSRTPGFLKAITAGLALKKGAQVTLSYPASVENTDMARLHYRQQISNRLRGILVQSGFRNLSVKVGDRADRFTISNNTHLG